MERTECSFESGEFVTVSLFRECQTFAELPWLLLRQTQLPDAVSR
jgi:hypothetical protein